MASPVLKSAFVVSMMTFVSRISGLIRDVALAGFLGSGAAADAFFVAFRIPNLFRRVFAEGAFSLAFVPVFSEYHQTRTYEEKRQFVNRMLTRLAISVLLVCVAGMLLAEPIIGLIAPGFKEDPHKFNLAVEALQITFPYLFFISLVAMAAGILNTHDRFAIPAVTPVLLNICLIAAAVWFVPNSQQPSTVLAVGVFVAGVVQLMLQIPFLKKQAILPVPTFARAPQAKPDGVKKVFKLMLPVIYGSSVAQINTIVNTVLASFLVTGSVSWLYYSDRVMEFPLGLFVLTISTVILPNLSKQHAAGMVEEFSRLIDWGLRLVLLIVFPAVVGMVVLSGPLIVTLFQYNQFSAHDSYMSALSLQAYAFGLIGLAVVKVLAPGYYARQDTKTPVKIGVIAMVVNLIFALILVWPFKHVGLAAAFSISTWVNAAILAWQLLRQKVYIPEKGWLTYLLKLTTAALLMGVIVAYGAGTTQQWLDYSLLERVAKMTMWVLIGMTSFVVLSYAMGLNIKQLLSHQPR